MSFNDEYLKLRKKRLEEQANNATAESKKQSNGSRPVMIYTLSPDGSGDVAPVKLTQKEQQMASTDERKWFQKGAFEDGYQFGDVLKNIGGSVGDLGVNALKGVGRLVEGVADLGGHLLAGGLDLFGQDELADSVRDDTNKSWVDEKAAPADRFLDNYSFFGDKVDAVGEGLGQVAAIILTGGALGAAGVGTAGVTATTTGLIGASSMGSGMSEAYLGGATDKEAVLYGLMKGTIDAGTELLFGGLGKTVKAVGLSKGISSLDDMFAKKLSSKISNQFFSNAVEFGVKSSAEGVEEVLAGLGSAVAKKLTYMSDEELNALVKDENLLDQFIVGTVTSGIAQSGLVPGTKKGSLIETTKQGKDFVTGLTANEQSVVDKVYEDRLVEAEEGGKELSAKEKNKLYDEVMNDLEKGRIDIDTIEEVLGEDVYKSYKDTIDYEDDILKQFEELGNKTNPTLAEQSLYAELKSQADGIKQNSQREAIKSRLSEEVFGKVKDTKLAESYNERARRGQVFEADLSQYDEKQQEVIKRAVDSGILNNTNRTHEFVDLIAKISADKGVLFDFTNNAKLKESGFAVDGAEVNGFVTKDGISINIDSHKALQSTVGHEITHVLEGTELYAEMQRALFDYAKSRNDYQGRYDSLSKLYEGIEGADIDAELTADLVGDYLFTDEDFVKHLSTQNRNVFQKMYDEIKYLWKLATAGSKEARDLEKVKRAFDKAYKESGKVDTKAEDFYDAKAKYSLTVKDKETLDFLNNQETITTYKTMQLVDGKLYPPMAARTDGKYEDASELGVWEQATEHPELIKNGNKFKLDKGKGQGSIEAAYNPYMHSSNLVLNDQFSGAYKRDNLVTVECEVPVSELTSGYHAEFAKDSVGWHPWHTGTVAGQLRQARGTERQVFLSRWIKPVRIVPDSEVAAMYKELLDGTDVEVPDNVVTPSLLNELKKAGVKIKESGRVKYSLTDSETDKTYADAVKNRDWETAQKLVDDAAKKAGYTRAVYHGTESRFTVFDTDEESTTRPQHAWMADYPDGTIFLAEDYDVAGQYGNRVMEMYLDTNDIKVFEEPEMYAHRAMDDYYGYEVYNYPVIAVKGKDMTIYATLDNTLVKSSLAATYDDNGNLIPLSERFKHDNPDIRFSLSKSVEETKDLIALHNLKSNELLKSFDLGGLPMPSIAITKSDAAHDQYGEISLILPKEAIDPQANRDNKVYGGDAWTPTYPKIEYKANETVAQKISDKYYELSRKHGSDEVRSLYNYTYDMDDTLTRHGGEASMLEDLYNSTGIMQVYLLDIGKGKVETVRKEIQTELSDAEVEMNEFFIKELGADVVDGVMNLGILSPSEHRIKYWGEHGEKIKEAYHKFLSEEYGFSQEEIENVLASTKTYDYMKFVRDAHLYRKNGRVTTKTEADYKATEEAIREAAGEGYKDWVDNLFKGIEEKSGIRNNVDYFTNSGNRRKWEALHWENTLENVVRVMKQQNQTGADAIFGASQIFATSVKNYKSIDEIKADSNRLYKMSEEEYESIKDSYSRRMLDIANRIMDKGERNQFIAVDNAMECIVDAVRQSKTETGILHELKQYSHLTVTEKDVADIVSLVNDIANMPTGYFEAKPMRAVGFDEVGVFVIPRNADVKLKQELLNRGYAIAEYDPDVEGDRQKVVNSFEEYKFSLSDANAPQKRYGNYNIYGKDVRYEAPMQEDISKMETTTPTVSKTETVAEETAEHTLPEKSNAPLVEIANQARLENLHGAYTQDGKQYLSDGSFAAEFYTVDDSLENVSDYPIKRVQRELTEAFERQTHGNYNIDQAEIAKLNDGKRKFAKVGNALFDIKYVDALNRAIENPLFTLSHIRGGIDALTVVGDNGRAVLMPVRAGDNVTVAYEAKLNLPVTDIDYAPMPSEPTSYELRQEQERLIEEAKKATDAETAQRLYARYNELEQRANQLEAAEAEAQSESLAHLDDADAPPEMEAPYYGETQDAAPIDPFDDRDMKEVSRDRKTPAYMYENPEVKPFFQKEAEYLLGEYQRTDRAETLYNGWIKQDMAYEFASEMPEVYRVSRRASETMEYLLDTVKMSYADIEKGLNAIIEDNGAENIAAAKKLEFVLNDRLLYGYRDDAGFEIPANQDYINLLTEKQIAEYSEEARKQFFDVADAYAPQEDIAPVAESKAAPVKEKYEAITPKQTKEPKLIRVKDSEDIAPAVTESAKAEPAESKTAEIYDTEPETGKKKSRGWARFRANFLDKQSVFEDLALKTNNRELMGKANYILSAEQRAQRLIGKGKNSEGVKSLNDIRAEVESTGKTKQFYEYLYHRHNIDRMSLEDKAAPTIGALRSKFGHLKLKQVQAIAAKEITEKTTERTANTIREAKQYLNAIETKNKPVFGDSVTAGVSRVEVARLEAANPEFKEYAKDVYDYMSYLRGQMVESGVISQDTARLWSKMYPHYVPIRRLGDTGLNINVPLDTGRTGVNAPIKRATGGSRDILPLFDTMALRTEQTYKAIAKNNFGVELKNTLGSTIESAEANLDEMIDSVDAHEELLKKGENGRNPTFTVFEDGKKVTFEITEDMYDALKPTSDDLRYTNKVANTIGNIHRGLLTEYNPTFMLTNAIKDAQDILINSQHPAKTYANLPNAIAQMAKNGTWYQEYLENGGESNTYFDGQSNTFTKDDTGIKKIIGMPLRAISALNNYVERAPRLAEYIASRKAGASAEVAMLDAARVTTNFAAGGDVTKFANRNGFTFLNASVQGAMQQVRNVREAKANGLKGWVQLATKVALAGIPAMILNNLLWDDDEEYEQLSDYVKDNYYVVAKFGDGQFVRIPKGRAMAVIQDALEQVGNALTGDDEVDLANFLELAISNLAPNNPLDNNILAPIGQVMSNKTWYGDDLVPTRLQDLPAAEQFDESTDSISKWLGEKLNISPYKLNYLLNQYSGGVGDVVLPMLTPEAESGDNSLAGNLIAPMKDKFTTDSVMNNQNVSDFYDAVDKLAANAKSSYATDEDVLKYKYMNSVNAELSELYKKKREIQNSNIADKYKYEAVREVQKRIDELAEESLNTYGNVLIDDGYAVVGDRYYRLNDKGEWVKITDKQLDKQEEVTSGLGINPAAYWENKSEYDFAYEYPGKYAVAKSVGGYENYKTYQSELYDIKADKDENGKSISGSRKEKVAEYINNLDADYGEKIILFKSEYPADDSYNAAIVQYLNNRNDISYDEMVAILKELGFTVKGNTVTWD